VVLAAGCGAQTGPGSEGSGIAGQVVLTPTCPGASPCPAKPVAAVVTMEWPDGERIDSVDTDSRGRFRAELPPGDYLVSARVPTEPDLVPRSTRVSVEQGRVTRVRVVIGTRLLEP
jgi:hypothetical protein